MWSRAWYVHQRGRVALPRAWPGTGHALTRFTLGLLRFSTTFRLPRLKRVQATRGLTRTTQ